MYKLNKVRFELLPNQRFLMLKRIEQLGRIIKLYRDNGGASSNLIESLFFIVSSLPLIDNPKKLQKRRNRKTGKSSWKFRWKNIQVKFEEEDYYYVTKLILDCEKWYKHQQEPKTEAKKVTILWHFVIQPDGKMKRNRPDIVIKDYKRKTYPWCNGYRRRKWTRQHEFKS